MNHGLKNLVPFLSLENNTENVWNQHWTATYLIHRSVPLQMFFKIVVLRNFTNFTREQQFWSLFLTNFLRTLLKDTLAQVFFWEICKTCKKIFFYRKPTMTASACIQIDSFFYWVNNISINILFLISNSSVLGRNYNLYMR